MRGFRRCIGVRGHARRVAVGGISAIAIAAFGTCAAPAIASPGVSRWTITATARPTNLVPGAPEQGYLVTATNTGDAPAEGAITPITVTDALPAGVALAPAGMSGTDRLSESSLTCEPMPARCTYTGTVLPGDSIVVTVPVEASVGAEPSVTNTAIVAGGGAASASASTPTTVGATPADFGIAPGSLAMAPSTPQAGAHANLTTSFAFNESAPGHPASNVKDVNLDTPPGFVGNATAVSRCTIDEVNTGKCPQDAAVGVAMAEVEFGPGFVLPFYAFVYNIRPYPTEPAALAFVVLGEIPVRLDFSVRSNGDYGLHASAKGINDIKSLLSTTVTLWGVPGDHNGAGPFKFFDTSSESEVSYGGRGGGLRTPFLRNPTSCGAGPLTATMSATSWEHLGAAPQEASTSLGPFTGCDRLTFAPSISITPETRQANTPSGYTVDLHVPQNESPDGLATPDLRTATVSLPSGTIVSPSAANGLGACSDSSAEPGGDQFGQYSTTPATCARASQVGTVEINTPLLPSPLKGEVFLGRPRCAPCSGADAQEGRMIRLFIQVQGAGVIVKLEGSTSIDQATGRLTTTFANAPQLPFEDFRLMLNGGSKAPLANAPACGVPVAASSQLTPYNSSSAAEPSSPPFELTGCPGGQFKPAFSAGTTNNQAGGFSAETVTFARSDHDQGLGGITVNTPPGLLGMISKVQQCPEAQAQAGTCGLASQIGTTTVAAGSGGEPFYLSGGVFLTGPYKGAPFGLSIVVHALAGPYDLGNVIVRAAISVNPITSALTIASDPLPQTLDGIPLQIRTVNVSVNREGFIFNPTSCSPMAIGASIASNQGATAVVSSPYQAANCSSLPFKPSLTVLTNAKTSKANGAYLHVKVVSGPGQANIGKLKVNLPKQLPSRLTTLQKACLAVTFNSDPAACPPASLVGRATALTPVLNSPLTGPAYLVSHGGAAFPDLVVVLQGEGITLELVGNTVIKKGITSSIFKVVPDAPVSSFDLVLPQGPHSVLAATGNLCSGVLSMPTAITGQNGVVVKQTTRVAVSGCPRRSAKKAGRSAATRKK